MSVPEHERPEGSRLDGPASGRGGRGSHGPGRYEPGGDGPGSREPGGDEAGREGPGGDDIDVDLARARLEDVLLALPYDRALPDLPDLLGRAQVPAWLLRRDDRLLKVLHEAVLARPLGTAAEAETLRTEVELLTLEVDLLTDRLADPATPQAEIDAATRRLSVVRRRLGEVRDVL